MCERLAATHVRFSVSHCLISNVGERFAPKVEREWIGGISRARISEHGAIGAHGVTKGRTAIERANTNGYLGTKARRMAAGDTGMVGGDASRHSRLGDDDPRARGGTSRQWRQDAGSGHGRPAQPAP